MTSGCSRWVSAAPPPRGSGGGRIPDGPPRPGLYHLAWEVGSLPELAEIRGKLAAHGALVGASDHRVSKSLYAKDPDGIEFEVMWRVPAQDWEEELRKGDMIAPLDLDAALARWGDTGDRRRRQARRPEPYLVPTHGRLWLLTGK